MRNARIVFLALLVPLLCAVYARGNPPGSYCYPSGFYSAAGACFNPGYHSSYPVGYPGRYGYSYGYNSDYYGEWAYWVYPGTPYYYRVRYHYCNGGRSLDNDGQLYTNHNGCYTPHCAIAAYLARPTVVLTPRAELDVIGQTVFGADPTQYAVAKLYGPKTATLLQQQVTPSPVDVAALVPPVATQRFAMVESVSKAADSASGLMATVLAAEQATERASIDARSRLALQANQYQAFERMLGKFGEMTAIQQQQATVSATANAPQIQVGDATLAQIIGTSCFQCHGGARTEAGLDFKQAGQFDAVAWRRIVRAVTSGKMPKGGPPLDDAQVGFFEDQLDRVRATAATAR